MIWSRRDFVKGFLALPALAAAPEWARSVGLRYVESKPVKRGPTGCFTYSADHTLQYGLNRITHGLPCSPDWFATSPRSLAALPLIADRIDEKYIWVLNANKALVDARVVAQYFHSLIR